MRTERHAHVHASEMEPGRRASVLGRALRLEYFSLGWNLLETIVGLIAGLAAGSVALIGFALDSVVESSSAGILVWRIRSEGRGRSTNEEIEHRAIRGVAIAFFALGCYVTIRAAWALWGGARPEESPTGIALAGISLVVMPLLAQRKRVVARELDSRALQADSRQTSLCTYLSAFLLVGLVANAMFGWWWADPVAGLVIAGFAAKEGYELWTTEDICCT